MEFLRTTTRWRHALKVRPSMRRRFNFDDRQRTSHSFAHPSVDSTLKQSEVERLSQRAA